MDDGMLDLELLNLLDEQDAQEEPKREVRVSPYRSAQQELFGQYVSMFQEFDDLLQRWEEEMDAQEAADAEEEEGSAGK